MLALSTALSLPLPQHAITASAASGTAGQTTAAFAGNFDPATGMGFDASVFQTGTGPKAQITLGYDIYISTPDSFTLIESGYGAIPAADVTSQGGAKPSSVTLHTDTSAAANPGFGRYQGPGGVLTITWAATSDYSGTNNGSGQERNVKTISFQWAGSRYFTSATATGTVLGHDIAAPSGGYSFDSLNSMQGMQVCRLC